MENQYIETIEREMRKGLVEFAVLSVLVAGKIYVSDILVTLKGAELITSEGTLYPLLSRLTKEEVVTYVWEESVSGPPRKYYFLTEKGKILFNTYKELWTKISNSINYLINNNGK